MLLHSQYIATMNIFDILLHCAYSIYKLFVGMKWYYPDSKVHRANMGPTWLLSARDGPHVGPTSLAIRVGYCSYLRNETTTRGPVLLTWFNSNTNMDDWLHTFKNVG